MENAPALTPEEEVARLLTSLSSIKRATEAEMRLLEARVAEFNRKIAEAELRLALAEKMAAAEGVITR